MNKLSILLACLLTPLAAVAGDYRAIVEVQALSERALVASSAEQVLHTYQPGDPVRFTDRDSCARETCEVKLPDGGFAWVASHKVTGQPDLDAEQKRYEKIGWDDMSKYELRIWAGDREKGVVPHGCAIILAKGEPSEKGRMWSWCNKFRHTKEVQEATATVNKALENMSQEDRQKMFNGDAPIGSPKGAVFIAWGKPKDTMRTITKDMVAEQLIYKDRVAVIENGILTMIQE